MNRKIIITFLIFFAPVAFIEHHKESKSSEINLEYLYNAEGNKFYLAEHLFDAKNEQKIKNLFGKRRTSSSETLLPT